MTFTVSTVGLPQLFTRFGEPVPADWDGRWLTLAFSPSSEGHAATLRVSLEGGVCISFWHAQDAVGSDLEQLRDCFNEPRRAMRRQLNFWRNFSASSDDSFSFRRGQRAFYRRRANECHARALDYAAEWRMAKAIWRNLVSLRQGR